MTNTINIHDRVKETSTSVGQGNFALLGAVRGFSSFDSRYNHLDTIFYAIVDNNNYEIGSGILHVAGETEPDESTPITYTYFERFPFVSSSNGQKVNFSAGIKEVFCTYPATHSVYMGSGVSGFTVPSSGNVAFWNSKNMLNADPDLYWSQDYKCLGIQNETPLYGIDIGGDGNLESQVRASGYYVGRSGVFFPSQNGNDSSYAGGTQYKHFVPNQTDENLSFDTNSELVFEFSGVVNQYLLLKKQSPNVVFAGPSQGCDPSPCDATDYPTFRSLVINDIPDLSSVYASFEDLISTSGAIQENLQLYIDDIGAELDLKYHAVSGNILSYISNTNQDLVSHFVAESGRVDDFIAVASGRIDALLPSSVHYSSVEIPAITAQQTGVYLFNFDGLNPSNNYTVTVTPSDRLESLLLSYSYVNALDTIESVFYNYTGSTSSAQTLNFNITVHEVKDAT